MAWKVLCLLIVFVISAALGEVADILQCEDVDQDKCTINEVRITPCPNKKSCRFKQGSDSSISFDFTPNFSASKLKSEVYWVSGTGDLPFSDFDTDACKFTACPSESNKEQQFNYSLHIGKKMPKGSYLIKWMVWNEEEKSQACCFKTNIQIRK